MNHVMDALDYWVNPFIGSIIPTPRKAKLEPVQQPSSYILTCEYCGRTTRVVDRFDCPACGASLKIPPLPAMIYTDNFGMSPEQWDMRESYRRYMNR